MTKITILIAASLMITGLSSCHKDYCDYMAEAPILFQYEYVNHAWGYHHRGFLIDTDGKVLGFDRPKDWKFPDSTGLLSKADLEFNLEYCDTICGQIETDDAWHYYMKLHSFDGSDTRDLGIYMADAGTGVLSGWVWNDKHKAYENVFLRSNGDFNRVNNHKDTDAIVDWLKSIGEKSNRFWWFESN